MIKHDFNKSKTLGHGFEAMYINANEWEKYRVFYPTMPVTFEGLKQLTRKIFVGDPENESEPQASGTGDLELFGAAINNPALTVQQLQELDELIEASGPKLDKKIENAFFRVEWTETSSNPKDNTAIGVVKDILSVLTHARESYFTYFGRYPYVPKGDTKISVKIYSLNGPFGRTSLNGAIDLDAPAMNAHEKMRVVSPPHELFHRIQYSFGMNVNFILPSTQAWFKEGSPGWAAILISDGYVSANSRITQVFDKPGDSFFNNQSYGAAPLWIYLQGYQGTGMMLNFLENLEVAQDANRALADTLLQINSFETPSYFMNSFFAALCGQAWISVGDEDLPRNGGQIMYTIVNAQTNEDVVGTPQYNYHESAGSGTASFCWTNQILNTGGTMLFRIDLPNLSPSNYLSMKLTLGDGTSVQGGIFYLYEDEGVTQNTGACRSQTASDKIELITPVLSTIEGLLINAVALVITDNNVVGSTPLDVRFDLTVELLN